MKTRLILAALVAGMVVEAGALYQAHLQISVMSDELYGQSNPLKAVPVRQRVSRIEDLLQVSARLCDLSKDKECRADLGMRP